MSELMMSTLKQYAYLWDEELIRIPLARWQRILSLEQAELAYRSRTIKMIYAYVEMNNGRPVFCHRIEAVMYRFDEDGFYLPSRLPDFDLLAGVQEQKVTYLSTKREQRQFFKTQYWEIPPLLLDRVLDEIWHGF
jgi:hypothetical protein